MAVNTPEMITLRRSGYRTVALGHEIGAGAIEVGTAIENAAKAWADARHPGFYDIITPGGCYYVHIFEPGRTIYVIAAIGNGCPERASGLRPDLRLAS